MHGIGLLQGVKVIPVASGAVVDTANYEGVMFVQTYDSAGASNALQGQHGDASNGSDQADAADALVDMDATATVAVLQVHKPRKRYVSADATGDGTMVAILYGARTQPVEQPAATTIATNAISPEDD